MLGSVKIYGKKRGTIAKKGPNTKTTSWKVIARVVLVSKNMAIYVLAPRVGYFAHMDSNKSETFLKSMPTGSVAIIVSFLSIITNLSNLQKSFGERAPN